MKLVLLDACEAFRIGLRAVLSRHRSDLEIVADAGRADAASIAALAPDIVLADIHIQPRNAVGLLARLRELGCPARVAVMSRQAPAAVVRQVLDAGAYGVLLTSMPAVDLVEAFGRLLDGDNMGLPPSAAAHGNRSAPPMTGRDANALGSLSGRERQVFDLVVWGWSNKEIAHHLSISVKTVETHRSHINRKLGARSSADIVRVAAFAGALDGAAAPILAAGQRDGASRHRGIPTR